MALTKKKISKLNNRELAKVTEINASKVSRALKSYNNIVKYVLEEVPPTNRVKEFLKSTEINGLQDIGTASAEALLAMGPLKSLGQMANVKGIGIGKIKNIIAGLQDLPGGNVLKDEKEEKIPKDTKELEAERTRLRERELELRRQLLELFEEDISLRAFEPAPTTYPVYVVSDFHLGSRKIVNGIDKGRSNDMHIETLGRFLQWLDWVDQDSLQHNRYLYHVVMNGDFLDIWQAARKADPDQGIQDRYIDRIRDIMDSSYAFKPYTSGNFFTLLSHFIRSHPRCRFYFVIGNHDDAFMASNPTGDPHFSGHTSGSLRGYFQGRIEEASRNGQQGNAPFFFEMQDSYLNFDYKLLIQHGHQHDDMNRREDGKISDGQELVEQHVNRLQEMWVEWIGWALPFENMDFPPERAVARYVRCLRNDANFPEEARRALNEFRDFVIDKYGEHNWDAKLGAFFMDDTSLDNAIISRLDPQDKKKEYREYAEDGMERSEGAVRMVVYGHTHLEDLHPDSGRVDQAYANSGTWLHSARFEHRPNWPEGMRCSLHRIPGDLPFIKIFGSTDEPDWATMQLWHYRGLRRVNSVQVNIAD